MRASDWMIVVTLIGCRVALGLQMMSVGAVGSALVDDMGLSWFALGAVVGAYALPGIAVALPGGWLVSRIGNRDTMLAALALMVVGGALMSVAHGYGVMLTARVLSGAGGALLSVVLPKTLLDVVPRHRLPVLTGSFIAGHPVGTGLALAVLPAIGSWRLALAYCCLACAAVFVAAALVVPRRAGERGTSAGGFGLAPGTLRPLLRVAVVWALVNACMAVVLCFVPPLLVDRGLPSAEAGEVASLALYVSVPIMPFGGWLLERTVGLRPGIVCGMAGLATVSLLLPVMDHAVPLMLAFGILAGVTVGPVFSLAGDGLQPAERALAMSIVLTAFYIAMAVAPVVAGLARDLAGDPATPFQLAALLAAVAGVAQLASVSIAATGAGQVRRAGVARR